MILELIISVGGLSNSIPPYWLEDRGYQEQVFQDLEEPWPLLEIHGPLPVRQDPVEGFIV
jgi:hypothetical protein